MAYDTSTFDPKAAAEARKAEMEEITSKLEKGVKDILTSIDYEDKGIPYVIYSLNKVQIAAKKHFFDFELIKCLFMYSNYGALSRKEKNKVIQAIKNLDERKTREILLKYYETFKDVVRSSAIEGEVGIEYILEEVDKQLSNIYRQLSLFDM